MLNLHSSMVRLEIYDWFRQDKNQIRFTFQYGQIRNLFIFTCYDIFIHIYIPVWLDQKSYFPTSGATPLGYLHSSMVRLEMAY